MNKSRFFLLGATAANPLILLVVIPHNAFAWSWGPGSGGLDAGVGNGNDGWYHQRLNKINRQSKITDLK